MMRDSSGQISFVLGNLEVEFFYHQRTQTLMINEHTIELNDMYFCREPSIFRDYLNHDQLIKIETICKDYFPEHNSHTVSACILELIGNRDPCCH